MDPVLEKLPSLAEQMGLSDFDFDDLKKKASELPEMTVDGLKKFVDAGFGTVTKMKTGDKRKPNQANKKKEPVVKKPKVCFDICYMTLCNMTLCYMTLCNMTLSGRGRTTKGI